MTSAPPHPDTIVLIHGFWVTPRSWEHWVTRYESLGYKVVTPAYPGFEVEVEALNADPSPVAALTVSRIVAHLESVVRGIETPPILMGHSAGGVFTQLLLDRGLGAVGVAINSAPTEGVRVSPLRQLRATLPFFRNPANYRRPFAYTLKQWHYAFTNTFNDEQSEALYKRYHVPASGPILWNSVAANFKPGRQDTWVNYRNDGRAPLLFISGGEDNLMPPAIQRSNAKHYKSKALTEVKLYPGRSHLMPAEAGWEEVADYALSWAETHAVVSPPAPAVTA